MECKITGHNFSSYRSLNNNLHIYKYIIFIHWISIFIGEHMDLIQTPTESAKLCV